MPKVLLISSRANFEVSEKQLSLAQSLLQKKDVKYDLLRVLQVIDLLPALTMILESEEYDGVVVCGVILSDNIRSSIIYQECLRNVYSMASDFGLPIGFSVIFGESLELIENVIEEDTISAISSCISLMELRSDLEGGSEQRLRYQN